MSTTMTREELLRELNRVAERMTQAGITVPPELGRAAHAFMSASEQINGVPGPVNPKGMQLPLPDLVETRWLVWLVFFSALNQYLGLPNRQEYIDYGGIAAQLSLDAIPGLGPPPRKGGPWAWDAENRIWILTVPEAPRTHHLYLRNGHDHSWEEWHPLPGPIQMAGEYNAERNHIQSAVPPAPAHLNNGPLPPASEQNRGWLFVVNEEGEGRHPAPEEHLYPGDFIVSNGHEWRHINLHFALVRASMVRVNHIDGLPAENAQEALEWLYEDSRIIDAGTY